LYSYAGSRLPTLDEPKNQPKNEQNNFVNTYDDVKQPGSGADKSAKISILFWEEGAVHWLGKHMLGQAPGCPIFCNYTMDKSLLPEVDAVLFHVPTYNSLPPQKYGSQKYVMFSMESEEYYTILKNPDLMRNFDLTMTYKLTSDVPAVYFSSNETRYLTPPQNKTDEAPVVFIASNCGPLNNRNDYVTELMKHIKVDSYGKCMHNKDFPEGDHGGKTKLDTMARYKFYLAFENNNNVDYVTEKYFQALMMGTVPVYMGAPNIDTFKPAPHSIIKVTDFESPKELAEYLTLLDKNDVLYKEYLEWKQEGLSPSFKKLIALTKFDSRCRLCLKLAGIDPNQI
jgi:alpha-1,3-fucosyltransferase 10